MSGLFAGPALAQSRFCQASLLSAVPRTLNLTFPALAPGLVPCYSREVRLLAQVGLENRLGRASAQVYWRYFGGHIWGNRKERGA